MKLARGVSVRKSVTNKAIVIETKIGEAKLTVAMLENIVKLNTELGVYPFNAGRKINSFLIAELA